MTARQEANKTWSTYLSKTRLAPNMKSARGRSSSLQRWVCAWSPPPKGVMLRASATTDLLLTVKPSPIHLLAVVLKWAAVGAGDDIGCLEQSCYLFGYFAVCLMQLQRPRRLGDRRTTYMLQSTYSIGSETANHRHLPQLDRHASSFSLLNAYRMDVIGPQVP